MTDSHNLQDQYFPGPGHYDRVFDSKYGDIYKVKI